MKYSKIPQEFLEKIKDSINLVDIVGEHLVLKKSGANHTGLCPFHPERSPSFFISEQKQLYHCYGCKKGGDLISFVQEIHGMSFPEAIEELAERARIPLPKDFSGDGGSGDPEAEKRRVAFREKQAKAYKLMRFVAGFYHRSLAKDAPGLEYFKQRHVDSELQRMFYVGSAPDSWDTLSRFLAEKRAPMELADELGLVRPSKKKIHGDHFDVFRARAMFPIIDTRGKIAAFGGRLLPGASTGGAENSPKYLNSPESFIFHKSKTLFGLYQAQKHIRESDEVILVEGYFDVLALWAAGIRNVVATCGTALTADHVQQLRRFAGRITLLFDGDSAGQSATLKSMELGLDMGVILYGATLPGGMDPDQFVFESAEGPAKMKELLSGAEPLLDANIHRLGSEAQGRDAEEVSKALKQVAGWLGRLKDPVGRQIRIQRVEKEFGWSGALMGQAFRASSGGEKGRSSAPVPNVQAPSPGRVQAPSRRPLPKSDRNLLKAWVRGSKVLSSQSPNSRIMDLWLQVRDRMPPDSGWSDLFLHPQAKALIERLLPPGGHPGGVRVEDWQAVLESEQEPQIRSIITEVLLGEDDSAEKEQRDPEESGDSEMRQALARNLEQIWARFSQRIKAAIAQAELNKDGQLQAKLMKEYLDVQRKMKEFNTFYDQT